MQRIKLKTARDLPVLRELDFIGLIKQAANAWAQSHTPSLATLEDRLRLFLTGDYSRPVHLYVQAESASSAIDKVSLRFYEAAACEFYCILQKNYDIRPDNVPAHTKMPLLPEYAALMRVREQVEEWIGKYKTLKQYEGFVQVLQLDSRKQIDIFLPYEVSLTEEARGHFKDLRTRAQRAYSVILHGRGINAELPVIRIPPYIRTDSANLPTRTSSSIN